MTRRIAWRHPEWWSLVLSAVAWVALVSCAAVPGDNHAFSHGQASSWLSATGDWMLMVAAMMLPLVVEQIRTTADRSLWRRRHRAIAAFVIGYVTPWFLLGVCISIVTSALGVHDRPAVPLAAAGFAIAAAWQLTAAKRRALSSCHRTMPLAPRGWRADRDCCRYGCSVGLRCVVSCWGLMLVCLLASHGLAVTIGATAVALAERYTAATPRLTFGALSGIAMICAALALSAS